MASLSSDGSQAKTLPLEQLIALNDEIAALVRAGVPLDQGLAALGSNMPGRLGVVARRIASQVHSGQDFLDAIGGAPTAVPSRMAPRPAVRFPAAYRAVIAAGLRSGHLIDAVEAIAENARRLVDLRRFFGSVFIYPLLVVWFTWVVLLFFFFQLAPACASFADDFQMLRGGQGPLNWLVAHWRWVIGVTSLLPVVWTLKAAWWWWAAGSGSLLSAGWARWSLGWIPGMPRAMRNLSQAIFADLLALQLQHETPLDVAIELAAAGCGNGPLAEDAAQIARRIREGSSLAEAARGRQHFPALVTWVFTLQSGGDALQRGLRAAAEAYRRSTERAIDTLHLLMPPATTLAVGLFVSLVYIGVIGLPWVTALKQLSLLVGQQP